MQIKLFAGETFDAQTGETLNCPRKKKSLFAFDARTHTDRSICDVTESKSRQAQGGAERLRKP